MRRQLARERASVPVTLRGKGLSEKLAKVSKADDAYCENATGGVRGCRCHRHDLVERWGIGVGCQKLYRCWAQTVGWEEGTLWISAYQLDVFSGPRWCAAQETICVRGVRHRGRYSYTTQRIQRRAEAANGTEESTGDRCAGEQLSHSDDIKLRTRKMGWCRLYSSYSSVKCL